MWLEDEKDINDEALTFRATRFAKHRESCCFYLLLGLGYKPALSER